MKILSIEYDLCDTECKRLHLRVSIYSHFGEIV